MKDFVVRLLSKQISSQEDASPLYEESFLLVKAFSLEETKQKVNTFIKTQKPHHYTNELGHLITWDHLAILELKEAEFEPDENGIWEISGRFFRDLDAFEKFQAID